MCWVTKCSYIRVVMKVNYSLQSKDLNSVASEAAWAEKMGYDSISSNETDHDSFLPLVLAATSTSHIKLQTHVAIAFPRSPMTMAYTAHDLHVLSSGRLRLGIGTQVKGHIERRFSTTWNSPGPRLKEYVQALRKIWECWETGEPLNYSGKYYQFSLMTPFFNPGPSGLNMPLICTAAVNPYNCSVAGEISDGLLLHSLTSPEYVRKIVIPGIQKGSVKAGRNPSDLFLGGGGFIITGPTQYSLAVQKEHLRRRISFYSSTRTYFPVLETHGLLEVGQRLHKLSVEGRWDDMPRLITDEILNVFAIVGEYDEIAPKFLERYGNLLDEVNFSMQTTSNEEENQLRTIIQQFQS